jgi:hypothetical protein
MRKRGLIIVLFIVVAVCFTLVQYYRISIYPSSSMPLPTQQPDQIIESSFSAQIKQVLGVRTKVSDCIITQGKHDRECTPGAIFSTIVTSDICTPGYLDQTGDVPQSLQDEVFREYGLASHNPQEYKVDHLIPLELGGSSDIANLWPQQILPSPGFNEKNKVENFLHNQVCKGLMSLSDAQLQISSEWESVYLTLP